MTLTVFIFTVKSLIMFKSFKVFILNVLFLISNFLISEITFSQTPHTFRFYSDSCRYDVKTYKFNIEMSKQLKQLLDIFDNHKEAKALIGRIIDEVDQKVKQDSWQQFELAFQNVHTEFGKNLITRFPHLTPGEVKLCTLVLPL